MRVYQVANWQKHFENDRSRKVNHCSFVCVPNKQHGIGFGRVMAESDGASIYGIWGMILGACSQQPLPREGWLTSTGECDVSSAWDERDLSMKFRRPAPEIARALEVLSSERIGWITFTDVLTSRSRDDHASLTSCSRLTHLEGRKEGTEGKKEISTHTHSNPPPIRQTPECARVIEEVKKSEPETATPKAKAEAIQNIVSTIAQNAKPKTGTTGALDELKGLLSGLYHRELNDPWTYMEQHTLAEVVRRPNWRAEWDALMTYRRSLSEKRFFPQSLPGLLDQWTKQLDKARVAKRNPSLTR